MTSPTPSIPPVQLSAALVSYAAGATDRRVRFAAVEPNAETEDQLRDFVGAFRVAAGQDQ